MREIAESPRARFLQECDAGRLAYQVDERTGAAVFYPRIGESLRWATSTGDGAIYAFTVVSERDGSTRNVALVDLDDGFRLMTCVRGVPDAELAIGMRGRVVMADMDGTRLPVFEVRR